MHGIVLSSGDVHVANDLAEPTPRDGESKVRVLQAGVCATDLALQRGYMGFRGVPGHEFVGIAETGPLAGQRVVGEINAACGACATCRDGLGRHCPKRTVLGILNHGGAFAEALCLPHENLLAVPDEVSDDQAVFTEPLAAAYEIVEQVDVSSFERLLVVGDGRLGLLCAQVLAAHRGSNADAVELFGRHPQRQAILPEAVRHRGDGLRAALEAGERWGLVVEATGSPEVFPQALRVVRPRGTLVLKTTAERPVTLDLAPLVVDEIQVVGSRCGPFAPALRALAERRVQVEGLIHARYPLQEGARAFEQAGRPGTLKVLIDVR